MSSSIVSPFPFFTDLTGAPLEGGYLYLGQSNLNPETAPVNAFWDAALTIPAANPVRTVGGYPSRAGTASRLYVSTDTYSITVRNRNSVLVFSAFNQSDSPTSVFNIATQLITATAQQVTFTLTTFTYLPGTETLEVYRNGLRLNLGLDYLETNSSVVTLTTPAAVGDQFLFQGGAVITGDQVPGSDVSFIQSGAGAVTRNMQDKVRESVSVKDFGAVGDGVTDDAAAFQAAANSANVVIVPATQNSYLLNSGIIAPNVRWILYGKLTGAGGLPGMSGLNATQLFEDIPTPSAPQPSFKSVVTSKGDNSTFIGGVAGYFEARDRSDVTSTNKGVLYGLSISVVPSQARNNVPFDDVDGLTISNTTGTIGATATDGIYLSHNSYAFTGASEWYSGITIDANCEYGIQIGGRIAKYGIDFSKANFITSAAIRFGNGQSIYWRNAAGTGDVRVLSFDSDNLIQIGGANINGVRVNNWFGTTVPNVVPGTTYTVGFNDNFLIFGTTGLPVTVTLPNAVSNPGRILYFRTTASASVVSASSNVYPLSGGPSTTTAILPATAGKWAMLVSDGVVWQVSASN